MYKAAPSAVQISTRTMDPIIREHIGVNPSDEVAASDIRLIVAPIEPS